MTKEFRNHIYGDADYFRNRDLERKSIDQFILNTRDQKVIKKIKAIFHSQKISLKATGIIYGAAHMLTYIRFLIDELGYVPYHSEFFVVFPLAQ